MLCYLLLIVRFGRSVVTFELHFNAAEINMQKLKTALVVLFSVLFLGYGLCFANTYDLYDIPMTGQTSFSPEFNLNNSAGPLVFDVTFYSSGVDHSILDNNPFFIPDFFQASFDGSPVFSQGVVADIQLLLNPGVEEIVVWDADGNPVAYATVVDSGADTTAMYFWETVHFSLDQSTLWTGNLQFSMWDMDGLTSTWAEVNYTPTPQTVPEPGSLFLYLSGLAGLALLARYGRQGINTLQ